MTIKIHEINHTKIAELSSDDFIISTIEDGIDLVGNMYYQGYDNVIIFEKNITPAFFDLKTKIAGEILQKFSNYRIRLVVVGDFTKYSSKSLHEFIFESNKGKHVNFAASIEQAIEKSTNM